MHKNLFFPVIVTLTILVVIGLFIGLMMAKNTSPPDSTMIFFYGDTCPHCKNVEEFFTENKIEEKISFEKLEVYNSATNAKIMTERYNKCGVTDTKKMFVPLLWDGSTCIQGAQPIIDYFKNKLSI